jgi:BlaI family transcriptional regulator, penicillinase repressor
VRQVRDILERSQPTGYTTVLKLFQIMTEKGLVVRDDSQRTHVYRASRTEAQTQRQLIGDLVGRAFGGSALKLVMQALATEKASTAELAEIRKLIENLERERNGGDS